MAVSDNVRWAINEEIDGVSGKKNREPVPAEVQLSGMKRNQPTTRQWFNQQLHNIGEGILQCESDYQAADQAEALARTNADTQLQQNIDAEALARTNTDNTLAQSIVDLNNDLAPLTGALAQAIIQQIYPVGSLYTTKSATTPDAQLGFGTWTKIAGKTIIGHNTADADFDTIGETGGSKTHTHSFSDTFTTSSDGGETLTIPRDGWGSDGVNSDATTAHTAGRMITGSGAVEQNETLESINGAGADQTVNTTDHTHTGSVSGTTGSTSNLPPYEVVYIWERTA